MRDLILKHIDYHLAAVDALQDLLGDLPKDAPLSNTGSNATEATSKDGVYAGLRSASEIIYADDGEPILDMRSVKRPWPLKDGPEWIEWKGGKQPVPDSTLVQVKFHDMNDNKPYAPACQYTWAWNQCECAPHFDDIIAYRMASL